MTKKLNIEHIREVAENKGIKLLSKKYVNNHTKLEFECENGHIWETTWKSIFRGGGNCPVCYWANPLPPLKYQGNYKEKRLEEIKKIVEERGGECLSDEYKDNFSKLLFRCEKGHEWESNYKSVILKNTWCPICLEESYLSIEDLNKIAKSRGGKCLSKSRGQKKLEWECYFGHRWKTAVGNIVGRKSWCPICSSGLYENICRFYFETLFDSLFPKSYPKWLVNNNGNRLELDGYCEELRLAFEHNGGQHYENISFFGNHEKIKLHDEIKRKLCVEHGIHLIVIPELFSLTKIEDLKPFIIDNIPDNIKYYDVDIDVSDIHIKSKNRIQYIIPIIESRNGKCISEDYSGGNKTKIEIMCNEGHMFKSTVANLKQDHWCPECARLKRAKTIQDAQKLAELKSGECLSTEYTNNHTKMLWKCEHGHVWETTYNLIQMGRWCPQCGRKSRADKQRLNIEVYREVAREKGGECLSTEYNNCFEKLIWKCAEGHVWEARADQIKNTKQWCPCCSGRRKAK